MSDATPSGIRMQNLEIARVLSELADLLEIQQANPFRVRAYRNAVNTIRGLTRSLESMVEQGEDLTSLDNVGKDISSCIEELVRTGRLERLENVAEEVPRELVTLTRLGGVGPRKARKLWDELAVTTIEELESAVKDGRVERLSGFGKRSAEKILRAIEDHRKHTARTLLSEADALVAPLLTWMREAPGVEALEVAGSYRRRRETVGDVDLLALCEGDGTPVVEHFTRYPSAERVEMAGGTRGSVVLGSGLAVDLRVLPRRSWGAALHYFTGSKEHNVELRMRGVRNGLRISEWGVFRVPEGVDPETTMGKEDGERVGGETEEEVFAAVGLPWIPPVLREGRGEIRAAAEGRLPELLRVEDLRGDLHMHSTWTDGRNTIEEMARACLARGYEYLAISDHSQAVAMVGGLTPEKARDQWAEIEEVQERVPGVTLLRSIEVDILRDGSLDLPDETLAELDLVVASVHSFMDLDRAAMTERVLRAVRHPLVDILAHPTGRLLTRRTPYELDVEAVLHAAAQKGVAVELNSSPNRLDLSDVHVRRARELGVKVAVDTDAHSIRNLDLVRYGVDQARRGWLGPEDVLNAMPLAELRAWLGRRRA